MKTTQPVQIVHIPTYMWDDLVHLFPEGFEDGAYELMNNEGPSYGDAEYTIIKGTLAERILFDAWDAWDAWVAVSLDAEEHDRNEVFNRLPSLINALVALRG